MSNNAPAPADPITAQRQAFRRITRAVAARRSASDALALIAQEARALTGAARVAIGLRADSGTLLDFVAVAGDEADQVTGLQIRVDDSLAEEVLRTGQPSLLRAGEGASGGGSETASVASSPTRLLAPSPSAAVVPISRDGSVLGALFALNKEGGAPFTEDDLNLLSLFAEQVTLAVASGEMARTCAEQARELAVLYDAAQTVSGSLNVQDVLNSVLDAVCQHLEHHAAVLFLLNDERTHLFIAADRGLTDDDREFQLAADGRVTAGVLESGQPLLITDTNAEPDFESVGAGAHTRSAMIAPIRSRDDTLGLVIVTSMQPGAYSPNDLKMLSAVAAQAGIAISNAWLYEDATRRAEEATALYDLSQHVNATLHLDRVFQFVADSVLNLLKVDKFALLLLDRREERLVTRISRGVNPESFGAISPRVGEGIAGWVFEWMTPQAVADVAADARNRTAPIHQEGVVSTICVPMAMGDEVIGVLLAMSSRRRLFTVAEMELLYTIANQAAVAIVNAMLYQDARSKSTEMRRYIHRIARALGSALEAQDVPLLLADLAVEVMRADRCAIYRLDGETVRLHATSHFRATAPPDSALPLGEGLTGWVAKRGKALTVESLADDPRARAHAWLSRERLASYLAVPLKISRRTVGVVEIYTQEPRAFSEDEVKLLTQFARRARVAERLEMEGA
jgi:GAF domain-containing protein